MTSLLLPRADRDSSTARRLTITDLAAAKPTGEKWPMLTCYDALTARIFDDAGIPVLLVGDSAAMVVYGYESTVPVTVEELLPLVKAVVRGSDRALIVADLPFGTYQESVEQAMATAVRFIKDGGAHAVKIEGGAHVLPQISALVAAGIPVMAHLGLTPQSVNQFGGYGVRGRDELEAAQLIADAEAVAAAGAFAIVLEVIPAELTQAISKRVTVPLIGIGAGAQTDGQVIVWQDLVGLTPGRLPKFVRKYAEVGDSIATAVSEWARDVSSGTYPDRAHSYE